MLSILQPMIKRGQTGFHHLSALPTSLIDPGQGPRPSSKHAQGLPTADMHHLLQASGSIGLTL
jgi:hypothetical protein